MKLTQEEYLNRLKEKYGDLLDFSLVKYNGMANKVKVICPKHGEFESLAVNLISKNVKTGCKKCGSEITGSKNRDKFKNKIPNRKNLSALENFIARAKEKYGDHFTYDNTKEYKNNQTNITVTCKIHGDISVRPNHFLSESVKIGCKECGYEITKEKNSISLREFIIKATEKYGDLFNYDKVTTEQIFSKRILITCKKHGEIRVNWHNFLYRSNHGCPLCAKEKKSQTRMLSKEEFISKVKNKFGDAFDLSKTVYTGSKNEVTITCKKHGDFNIKASNLLSDQNTYGCPTCGKLGFIKNRTWDSYRFIVEAKRIHGETYDYSKVDYINSNAPVTIICKKHGEFRQCANNHLNGYNCPTCTATNSISRGEKEISEFLISIGADVVISDRTLIKPKEIDILVHNKKLCVEYCGLYWHSEAVNKTKTYHLDKLRLVEETGYRLITIFEDEWKTRPMAVKFILQRALGISNTNILGARKTEVLEDKSIIKEFLNSVHIQGAILSEYNYYLSYRDIVVAAITIGKRNIYGGENKYEIIRYASHPNYYVSGGLSKLMSHFYKITGINELFSYIDRRWFTGTEYLKQGFEFVKYTPPGYYYVKAQKRFHRAQFQKHKLQEKLKVFDPNLTELQNMELNGYSRIYDCGQMLVKWSR